MTITNAQYDALVEARSAERGRLLDEVEAAFRTRMHGGIWLGEPHVLEVVAELRKKSVLKP